MMDLKMLYTTMACDTESSQLIWCKFGLLTKFLASRMRGIISLMPKELGQTAAD